MYVKHKIIYISSIRSLLLITNIKTKEGSQGSYFESPFQLSNMKRCVLKLFTPWSSYASINSVIEFVLFLKKVKDLFWKLTLRWSNLRVGRLLPRRARCKPFRLRTTVSAVKAQACRGWVEAMQTIHKWGHMAVFRENLPHTPHLNFLPFSCVMKYSFITFFFPSFSNAKTILSSGLYKNRQPTRFSLWAVAWQPLVWNERLF